MKMKSILCLALFAFTLTACGFSQPEHGTTSQDINVGNGDTNPVQRGYPGDSVRFISFDLENKATSAKLFTGNKSFAAGYGLTGKVWSVDLDACKDLPQGKNIPIRFDQYDAAGQVLISQQTTLSSVDAC